MTFEAWFAELHELIEAEFAGDEEGHRWVRSMLDGIDWDVAFDVGRSPREAVEDVIGFLRSVLKEARP